MSATETRSAIDEAIRAHISSKWGDDLIVDWCIVVATLDTENLTGIGLINSRDPMPGYIVKGLLMDGLDDIRAGSHDYDEGEGDR